MTKRVGNKRGFGGELRAEIIAAAERLLAEQASSEALTLRAIAREAGIAAPSIYAHFPDRDAILDAVVERAFDQLGDACGDAAQATPPGRSAVLEMSLAYVRFARAQPGQYRIMFERSPANIASPPHPYQEGTRAFDVLLRVMRAEAGGGSGSDIELVRDAQTLLAALHGIAVLRPALPGFAWQDEDALIGNAVGRICLTAPHSNGR